MSITTKKNYIIYSILDRFMFLVFSNLLSWYKILKAEKREINPPKKVLIIKFTEQGAIALISPILLSLKDKYKSDNVFVLTMDQSKGIFQALNICRTQNLIYINTKDYRSFFLSFFSAMKQLRRESIDLVFDLHFFSFFSFFISNYLGHQISHFSYRKKSNENNIFNTVRYIKSEHMFNLYKQLFSKHLIYDHVPDKVSSQNNTKVFNISIYPNPSDKLSLRKWPLSKWKELILLITKKYKNVNIQVVSELKDYDVLKEYMPPDIVIKSNFINIKQLINYLKTRDLLITSDSGPAHFSTVANLQTITLYGPESPYVFGNNYLKKQNQVVYKGLNCSPCFNQVNGCLSTCNNNICMTKIEPSEILEKLATILG